MPHLQQRSLPPAATASQLRPEAICAVQLSFVAFIASSFTPGHQQYSTRESRPGLQSEPAIAGGGAGFAIGFGDFGGFDCAAAVVIIAGSVKTRV